MIFFAPLVVNYNYETHLEEYLSSEIRELETIKEHITIKFLEVEQDIKLFSSDLELYFKDGNENNKSIEFIKLDFFQNLFIKKEYDQISYLNISGFEKIKIINNGSTLFALLGDELQNKSSKKHFIEALKLNRGEMFISPLHLNIEQGEIEIPIKPIIRFSSPVFSTNDSILGIITLNYLGNDILNELKNMDDRLDLNDDTILINKNGNIFKGLNTSDEWGSFLSHNITFKNKYEHVWSNIDQKIGFIGSDEGFYTYYSFNPLYSELYSGNINSFKTDEQSYFSYEWILISFISQDHLSLKRNSIQDQFLQFSLPFIILFFIFSLIFSNLMVLKNNSEIIRRNQEKKQKSRIERSNMLLQNQRDELSGFAHAMKHDLGNYLSALSQYIQLFKLEKNEILLASMEGQINKIEKLLHHSLKLADLGLVIDKKTPIKIDKILADFVKSFNNIEIIKQEEFPLILGDEQKIQEMILNIVENAIFHGKANSITFKIHKSPSGDDFYNFLIKNDGQSINKDIKDKIFNKGFSTKINNKSEFGLGLYIVSKICNSHGWSIQLKDNLIVTYEIKIPYSDIIIEKN